LNERNEKSENAATFPDRIIVTIHKLDIYNKNKFMKKLSKSHNILNWKFNFDLKIKLSVLLMGVTAFALHADPSYSPKTKISMNMENFTISEVFDAIENNTEFTMIK